MHLCRLKKKKLVGHFVKEFSLSSHVYIDRCGVFVLFVF